MTPEPASHRIDWTLSATPTRRGVRVFVIVFLHPDSAALRLLPHFLILAITLERGPRAPERSFTALDFFPPTAIHPSGYEVLFKRQAGTASIPHRI